MESHAQSVEDNLIDSLTFKLRPGASYVTDRKSVSYFPQGGNQYSPAGVKVMKIMLNGSDWLDPSTCKIFMNVNNDDDAGITPLVAVRGVCSLGCVFCVVDRSLKTSTNTGAYMKCFT